MCCISYDLISQCSAAAGEVEARFSTFVKLGPRVERPAQGVEGLAPGTEGRTFNIIKTEPASRLDTFS